MAVSTQELDGVHFDIPFDSERRQTQNDGDTAAVERNRHDLDSHEDQRRLSVIKAYEFLEHFVQTRWEENLTYVKIHCDLTLDEVMALGRLDQPDGVRECRKLLSAPVIHDEMGYTLWRELAKRAEEAEEQLRSKNIRQPSVDVTGALHQSLDNTHLDDEPVSPRDIRAGRRLSPRAKGKTSVAAEESKVVCNSCGSKAAPSERVGSMSSVIEEVSDEEEMSKRPILTRKLSLKGVKGAVSAFGESLSHGYGGRTRN